MEEWTQISEAEKRKRIREALRSPASRVITDLKQDLPGATARDYFAALEAAFGTTESGEELLIQYHCMKQKEGEKTSTYLSRLQTKLRQVIRKGGISPENVNSARLRQFVRGLLFDEMLITSLHLRDAENDAPGYISLLKMVRRYEEEQAIKLQQRKSQNHPPKKPGTALANSVSASRPEEPHPPADPRKREEENLTDRLLRPEGEVKALKLVGDPQTAQYPVPAAIMTPEYRQWTSGPTRHPSPNFCFRCGRTGHISRNCSNEADVQEVNRKLIKFVMGQPEQENSRGPMRGGTQGSNQ
ncbi:Paraneoplastic antigen Ma1 [Holothuria leucospilota]|uniref:Paraneoplastic antigen Ma1 n=1 Tax=Holothuria leucospilota TaxID=206669 RepID=A0A9Q1HBX0_HOLLE|nr:Paraneoplastic antigen Ma1 [Holothuria leucospilota]